MRRKEEEKDLEGWRRRKRMLRKELKTKGEEEA